MTDRVFIDVNVLLDILWERAHHEQSLAVFKDQDGVQFVTSILAVDLVLYHVEKDRWDKQAAHKFLDRFGVLDMNQTDYEWAKSNDQGDFEDALQVACALRHNCKKFITLDKALAKNHDKHIEVTLIA